MIIRSCNIAFHFHCRRGARDIARSPGGIVAMLQDLTPWVFAIVPFSRGGSNTVWNLQLLCESCNLSKSNRI